MFPIGQSGEASRSVECLLSTGLPRLVSQASDLNGTPSPATFKDLIFITD